MPRSTLILDGRGVASIARNLTFLLGSNGVYFVTRFLYAIVLARVLGPQIYGLINYGIAWYLLFLPLTRMGLDVVLSRDAGKTRREGDKTAALTLTLRVVFTVAVTVAYLILSFFFENDPASRLMVFVFTFALIGRSLATWAENVYTAYEVNQYTFWQQTFFRPLEVIIGFGVILVWRDALLVVVIHGLFWCLQAIYGLAIIRSRLFSLRLDRNLSDLCRVFLQGLPLGVTALLITLPYQGPLIFFRHFASSGDSLGQLALAMQVLFMLSLIPFALGSVSMPVLSRSAERGDGKDRLFAETALRFSLFFGAVLALLGKAFGPWLTVQIFGKSYAQAGALVGPVLWLMIPWSAGLLLMRVLMARRLDFQALFCALAGAVIFSLTISEAVLRYGALGAIWSGVAGMTLTTMGLIFVLRVHTAMDLRVSLIKPGLTVMLSAGAFYGLRSFSPALSLLSAFVVLAGGCYLRTCLAPQDVVWFGHSTSWVAKKMSLGK